MVPFLKGLVIVVIRMVRWGGSGRVEGRSYRARRSDASKGGVDRWDRGGPTAGRPGSSEADREAVPGDPCVSRARPPRLRDRSLTTAVDLEYGARVPRLRSDLNNAAGWVAPRGPALPGTDEGLSLNPIPASGPPKRTPLLSRLGGAGFLFFLIKGLIWLALPALLVAWRSLPF